MILAEPYAGLAAASIVASGAEPLASRMGSKRGVAPSVLSELGVLERPRGVVLAEADPRIRAVWESIAVRDVALAAAAGLETVGDGRDAFDLAAKNVAEERPSVAPWYAISVLYAVGNSYEGSMTRFKAPPSSRSVPTNVSGATLARRLRKAALLLPPLAVFADARDVEPFLGPGDVAFLDPPYVGTAKYDFDEAREDAVFLALRLANRGVRVGYSENDPVPELVERGWKATKLSRTRQKSSWSSQEWITVSPQPSSG